MCTERKFRWLKFSNFFILGENGAVLFCPIFTIGYGDKVKMVNVKEVIIPGGMIKMFLGQVSVWNFSIW